MNRSLIPLVICAGVLLPATSRSQTLTHKEAPDPELFWSVPIPAEWPEKAHRATSCRDFAVQLLKSKDLPALGSQVAHADRQIASVPSAKPSSLAPSFDFYDQVHQVHAVAQFTSSKADGSPRSPATVEEAHWTLSLLEQGSFEGPSATFQERETTYHFKLRAQSTPGESSASFCQLDQVQVKLRAPASEPSKSVVFDQSLDASSCEAKVLDYHDQHEHFAHSFADPASPGLEALRDDYGMAELCRDSIPYFAVKI